MDGFFTTPVIWILIGFLLFVLEFIIPGLVLFFFAVGAWIVGILCLFLDITINGQLIIFLASSLVCLLLLRRWTKKVIFKRKPSSELLDDEFLGKTAIAETEISPLSNGWVSFKGTSWQASSEDIIEKGESVTISGNESIVLIVKSTQKI